MDIAATLHHSELLSEHQHERTWLVTTEDGAMIAKARLMPDDHGLDPRRVLLPRVAGVAWWEHLRWLPGADRRRLGLPEGSWLLALRRHVPGRDLRADLDALSGECRTLGATISRRLLALHAQGVIHGDLQPGNVLRDSRGRVWLIDLPIWSSSQKPGGRVAGSAPYMAPELWEGAEPTEASDRYALAALVFTLANRGVPPLVPADGRQLSEWARLHREERPGPPPDMEPRLAGLLLRAMAKAPGARPPLQELADALSEVAPEDLFCTLPPSLYRGLEGRVLDALDAQRQVILAGASGTGRTYALQRLMTRLELQGRPAYLWSHGRLQWWGEELSPRRLRHSQRDPWEPLRELLHALDRDATPPPMEYAGDGLQVLEAWQRALREALPGTAVILWDDLDCAPPDLQSFWRYYSGPQGFVASVADTSAEGAITLTGPDVDAWNGWRARTLLQQVRDIPSGRWEALLRAHGDGPTRLFREINRELGAPEPPELVPAPVPALGRRDISVILAQDWRAHLRGLLQSGAFAETIETCRDLFALFRRGAAEGVTPRTAEAIATLAYWRDALAQLGPSFEDAREFDSSLQDYLSAHGGSETTARRLRLLLAQHRCEFGLFAEGLSTLDELGAPPDQDPEAARWRAQILLSSGRFDEAADTARAGLSRLDPGDGELYCHLAVVEQAGGAIQGDPAAIQALQDLAPSLLHPDVSPELRARAHSYRALGFTRRGELASASDAYLRALEEVESAGLLSKLPTYLLNVGTAYHRQGQLGLAREYYARGSRLATEATRASTRALLLANQANIDITLGRFSEARPLVQRARGIAEGEGLLPIELMCRSLAGDIALGTGATAEALSIYTEALEVEGAPDQQIASLHLYRAEALLRLGNSDEATADLDSARDLIETRSLGELAHHQGLLRARQQFTDGGTLGTMAGIELFRRHLMAASQAGNHRLVLSQTGHLLERLTAEGLDELLAEAREILRSSRNAVAMGLTRELREEFFAHLPEPGAPSKTGVRPATAARTAPPLPSGSTEPFYRMLSLNEAILHLDSADELWDRALAIALSLSRAERGFLLILDEVGGPGDYRIRASRGLDGDPIPRPHLKVSRTIAEEAAATGRTVLTTNARQDGRFDSALSVVDLDLTSVLCVPVRSRQGTLGALYLDHRFESGTFDGEIPRMMEAFANQLAIAITNHRSVQALRREEQALREARARLSELVAERDAALKTLQGRYAALSDQLEQERRQAGDLSAKFPDIAFASAAMEDLLRTVERVAASEMPAVIVGESGVGKELIASALHHRSGRRDGPFVALNCGALSEDLFASEMFGHRRGAFTGAERDRRGLFETATGGTLFLDEVGELPLSMQVMLLRALQELKIRPVGSDQDVAVDVRVIAATNRDLRAMVEAGTFREDLYYRLATIVLPVPPLRERREDIPLLADHLLGEHRLAPDALPLLLDYHWPGNIRELQNTLQAAAVFADGDTVNAADVFRILRSLRGDLSQAGPSTHGSASASSPTAQRGRPPKATRADVETALRAHGSDRAAAANALEVSERTLYRYLSRYDLT